MEQPRHAHVCHDCRARAPDTDTNYTLISSRYGWRLTRHVEADGTFRVEWRCPRCWERYKRAKQLPSSTPSEGVPAATLVRTPRPFATPFPTGHVSSAPPPPKKKT